MSGTSGFSPDLDLVLGLVAGLGLGLLLGLGVSLGLDADVDASSGRQRILQAGGPPGLHASTQKPDKTTAPPPLTMGR